MPTTHRQSVARLTGEAPQVQCGLLRYINQLNGDIHPSHSLLQTTERVADPLYHEERMNLGRLYCMLVIDTYLYTYFHDHSYSKAIFEDKMFAAKARNPREQHTYR